MAFIGLAPQADGGDVRLRLGHRAGQAEDGPDGEDRPHHGEPRVECVDPLDEPRHTDARILIARRNFGTGSSREAAVYALWDYGIACVIAPSFGDIFASNAVKNGLLPAQVSEADAETLLGLLADGGSLTVDLEAVSITVTGTNTTEHHGQRFTFVIDPVRRLQLLNGWDDIDLTLRHTAEIAGYRASRATSQPWIFP
jgi:3-isopropylmalate/(R)-2-methylmalate dehydratase small subunit